MPGPEPPSEPRRDDDNDDTQSVQIVDGPPKSNKRNQSKPKTGSKRAAVDDASSVRKKAPKATPPRSSTSLASSPPPLNKFVLVIRVEYEDINHRSTQMVVNSGAPHWYHLQIKEKAFLQLLQEEADAELSLVSREATIYSNSRRGRLEKSAAIWLDSITEWRQVEDTIEYQIESRHSDIRVEVTAVYSTSKSWKKGSISKPISAPSNKGQAKTVTKKPTLTESVLEQEMSMLSNSKKIRELYGCNSGTCTTNSYYCVPDPDNQKHLGLDDGDIVWWARQRNIDHEFSIDPPHPSLIQRLREKGVRREKEQKKKQLPPQPSQPTQIFNVGWQPSAVPSSAPAPTSSPPREVDLSCEEFCEFVGRHSNTAVKARLQEVGHLLDSKFWAPSHVHRLARDEKSRLRAEEIEDGIIERLASQKTYRAFLAENS